MHGRQRQLQESLEEPEGGQMDDMFQYAVGVGPAVVLLVLVATGLIYDIQKKRRRRRDLDMT